MPRPSVELFLSDTRGIYIPRDFTNVINSDCWFGITSENLAILKDPDHEWYWEAWDEVLNDAFAHIPSKGGWQYDADIIVKLADAASEDKRRMRAHAIQRKLGLSKPALYARLGEYKRAREAARDAILASIPGHKYTLHQDGDVFAIPDGMEWSDKANTWVWPDDGQESES